MVTSRAESGAGQRIIKPTGWESPRESESVSTGIRAPFERILGFYFDSPNNFIRLMPRVKKARAFETRRPKTFASFPPGDVETFRVKVTEVFCGAFLQKSDRFLCLLRHVT
jgi:hypothetical protein